MPKQLDQAPPELLADRLHRLGEGIGKVVYSSEHWVVKRHRTAEEMVALILVWKFLHKVARGLPGGIGAPLLHSPPRVVNLLRVLAQSLMVVVPKRYWHTKHVSQVLYKFVRRAKRGDSLARTHLVDSPLLPQLIQFPPKTVVIDGWPGWMTVSEATERVDTTLDRCIGTLAQANNFAAVETWLDRLLETRQAGWRSGLFSVDAHLKNFGVIGDRIVLLDTGGLTNRWGEIADKLAKDEQVRLPHVQLGLATALATRPDIAAKFNERWKSLVNRQVVVEILGADQRED